MSEERYEQEIPCSHDCSSCASNCASRKTDKSQFAEPMNQYSNVKKVIGVVSGKGGVGKSFVTAYLAVLMRRMGYKTAVLDADVTGPSIPMAFGVHKKAQGNELGILPEYTKEGTAIMSVNLLLENEEIPVVWRGPVIAGTVKQFWSQVVWGDVDYMFVDMPPGTGDVPLTVFQSLPVDGVIIVTSPQDLVSMVVAKAVNMAREMEVPVLGLVENYSYVECGHCGEKMYVFGESHIEDTARKFNLPVLGRLPLNPCIAKAVDAGDIEGLEGSWLEDVTLVLKELLPQKASEAEQGTYTIAVATDEQNNIFQHFGKCVKFTLYSMSDGILMAKSVLNTEGNGHEAIVNALAGHKVKVLLCGGIGMEAMEALLAAGVTVIPGMNGDIDVAVEGYLDGSVRSGVEANCGADAFDGGNCSGCAGCR
ncbi:MAG: P-loop NTPase [Lachnospiraceae bacterium]|nr:P-loop NTPase [Lachnospiraceae bacterium]